MPDFVFQKSSFSSGERECVEVAINIPGTVAVRDSKNPEGPILRFTPTAWAAFSRGVEHAEFDSHVLRPC